MGPSGRRAQAESRVGATVAGDSGGGTGGGERDEGCRGEAGRRQTGKGFEELLGGQGAHTVLGRQMETNGRLGAEG